MAGSSCPLISLSGGDIFEALEKTRRIQGPKTLDLGDGTLSLSQPLMLDARDDGLTLTGTAKLTVARSISRWRPEPDGLLSCTVPEGIIPTELIINGTPRTLAVYPLAGYLRTLDRCQLHWRNSENGGWDRPPSREDLTCLTLDTASLPNGFDPAGSLVTVFHQWDESTVEVVSFDSKTGHLQLSSPMEHPSGAFGRNECVFRGVREGMSVPGVWYWDRKAGRIFYHPLPGETGISAYLPTVSSPILIRGASGVTVSGLTFCFSGALRSRCGLRGSLAPGAIDAEDAQDLILRGLKIVSPGGSGIRLCRCSGARVLDCLIENAGVCGVYASDCFPAEYRGCRIRDVGRLSGCAVGIVAGGRSVLQYVLDGRPEESGGVVIAENEISGSPYCGIALGGGPHLVEGNVLSNCMRVLRDGAAVYCSRGIGTILRGNTAISCRDNELSYAWYLDEWSENCLVEHNLADGFSVPFQFHRAKHCVIRGNRSRSPEAMTIRATMCRDLNFRDNTFEAVGNLYLQTNREETEPSENSPFHWENNTFFATSCIQRARIWRQDGTVTITDMPIDPPEGLSRTEPKPFPPFYLKEES